jgi:hypothetical protein
MLLNHALLQSPHRGNCIGVKCPVSHQSDAAGSAKKDTMIVFFVIGNQQCNPSVSAACLKKES